MPPLDEVLDGPCEAWARACAFTQGALLHGVGRALQPALVSAKLDGALDALKGAVKADPDWYRSTISGLAVEDEAIYRASFHKSAQKPHGDPDGYAVLDRCAALAALEFDPTEGQPTTQLYPLVLAVRREIPAFKAAVAAVLAAAGAPGTATSYRELTKSPYRMIE